MKDLNKLLSRETLVNTRPTQEMVLTELWIYPPLVPVNICCDLMIEYDRITLSSLQIFQMDSFHDSENDNSVRVPMHELTAQQINQLDPFRYVL